MDGVDAALLSTDGVALGEHGQAITVPYPEALRQRLRAVLGGQGPIAEVEREMTLFHADAVASLLEQARVTPQQLAVIGFHGHTILHRPKEGVTWQIGDGQLLADRLGVPVVNDFRRADVAAGGEGAPLVPVFHAALAKGLEKPVALLNIGGVANVTWIGPEDHLLAFDTGPGNALLDDWVLRHTGQTFDRDGHLAAAGAVDETSLKRFLAHPFFCRVPPKSLDRDDFAQLAGGLTAALSVADGAALLSAVTAAAVALAQRHFPSPVRQWLVAGGGRRNPQLMRGLRTRLQGAVEDIDTVGWDGDALEAQAFAFLAMRSLRQLPLTWPGTTGVPSPQCGGHLSLPKNRP